MPITKSQLRRQDTVCCQSDIKVNCNLQRTSPARRVVEAFRQRQYSCCCAAAETCAIASTRPAWFRILLSQPHSSSSIITVKKNLGKRRKAFANNCWFGWLKQLLNASGQELCNCSSKVIKNTQKWWKLALLALGPNKGTKVFGGMPPSPPYRY